MSMTVENHIVSMPIPRTAVKLQSAAAAVEDLNGKKAEAPSPSAGEEILSTGSAPINYLWQNDLFLQNLYSFIEQKFRIIEEIRNASRPDQEEINEQEEAEAKEKIEEIEEQMREVEDEIAEILEQIDSLMALMSMPAADPEARMSMISGQLRDIVSKLAKLGMEIGMAIAQVSSQDTSGLAPGTIEILVNNLTQLDQTIASIKNACQETTDQLATA